jgi:hypothetical protein
VPSKNCLEGLKKTTKTSVRTEGVPAEIQTEHLRNINLLYVRSEVFTVMTIKNAIFWDVTFQRNVVPPLTDSCHADDGGALFLQNISSYKSHMA